MLRVEKLLENFKWDTVIILDACRYDFYKLIRPCQLGISPGKDTCTSIPKMFPHRYSDVVYISANPYINSKLGHEMLKGWIPRQHFFKVIDVWDWGWDEELGTVHPAYVEYEAIKWQKRGFRTVVHFIQPHGPYVLGKIKVRIGEFRKARAEVLGKQAEDKHETADIPIIRKAYFQNLREVLKYTIPCINGNTIILADHGECLGENGYIGHSATYDCDILHKVPVEVIC